jgi:Leucine-rich repeat (LRR) protein
LQSSLSELNLENNPIKIFPTVFGKLFHLKKLNLESCQFEGTVEIDGFDQLNELIINFQKIDRLILKKHYLRRLELIGNRITKVSIEEKSIWLEAFNLSNNPLKKLPLSLANLPILKKLNLNNTKLADLSGFTNLTCQKTLEDLHLAYNRLIQYPNLSEYSNLINIDFSQNQFKELPSSALMNQPKSVNLSHNLITEFDINAINSSIEELSLKGNSIQKIVSRGSINKNTKSSLIKLDLSYNKELENFGISYLELFPHLQELNLYATNIKYANRVRIEQYCESNDIKVNFDDEDASDGFFKNSIFKE